jgi:hypothetical protein
MILNSFRVCSSTVSQILYLSSAKICSKNLNKMNCCRNYFGLKRMLLLYIGKSRTFTFHFIVTLTAIRIQNPIVMILNSFRVCSSTVSQILYLSSAKICSKNLNKMNCCRNYFGLKRMLHQCIEKSRTFTFHFIFTITVIIIQNPIIVILNSFSL